jgi:hypothetical protein
MAIFGMAISELLTSQKVIENFKNQDSEKLLEETKKKAEIILKEAALESEKIIYEANKKATSILEQKKILERKLKEFIDVEKELIKKYDTEKN